MTKVLFISKSHTHPINTGYSWGILAMCRSLQQLGCEIHFLYVLEYPLCASSDPFNESKSKMENYWKDELSIFQVPVWNKIYINVKKKYRKYFCKYEEGCDDAYPIGLTEFVRQLNKKYHFDSCIVNCYYLSKLFENIRFNKNCIFTEDCFAYKNQVTDEKCFHLSASSEAKAMQRAEHLFTVQDEEFYYYRLIAPRSHVYNIYSRYEYHRQKIVGNHNILFFSGSNSYNINGINWFVQDIFPLIQEKHPDSKLIIGGGVCKYIPNIALLPNIILKGYVENPADFYCLGDIAINPVFQGTGLKIKTFESVSYDKVTITHTHSIRGIFKKNEAPIFASDNPYEWVKLISGFWMNEEAIAEVKRRNEVYIKELDVFIMNEYLRFLNNK